jgi:hypothetical protein
MEKNFNIIAKELFGKIRTQFPAIKLGDKDSKTTNRPEDARFFEFEYEKDGNALGSITISLSDDGMAVMYSNSIVDDASNSVKSQWFKFLRSLRDFAKQHLLNFDTRDITKSNLEKRDYEALANKNFGEGQMTESKLWGSSRTSYQDIGESRLIVKHTQPVNGEVPAGRARHIEGIYIENAQGERFKYPYKHLNGARAMARHVANGGTPYDQIGEHLVSLSEELGKLRMFKGYVDRNEMVSEAMSSIQPKVSERIQSIKKEISGLQSQRYYESFVENFTGNEDKQIPEDVMNDWVDRLTIRTFNEELKNVFPYIYKLIDESDIPVVELSAEDLITDNIEDTSNTQSAKALDEEEAFESFLTSIIENSGILSTDEAAKEEAVTKLKELLAAEMPVGTDGVNAIESLAGIIDDKELHEIFKELADVSPEMDARQVILDYVQIKDEENGTDIYTQLSGEPAPAEAPAEEPAPAAPAPTTPAAPAAPAAVPPAQEDIGDLESVDPDILEFVESMFDKETGRFPKGETGVMLAVEKKFGDNAVPHAQQAIETLISVTESYRIKKLAGLEEESPFTNPDYDPLKAREYKSKMSKSMPHIYDAKPKKDDGVVKWAKHKKPNLPEEMTRDEFKKGGKHPGDMSDEELAKHKGKKVEGPGSATWRKMVNKEIENRKKSSVKEDSELAEMLKIAGLR